MYKIGDLVVCEYLNGEKAKGRIVSINDDKFEVEIAIVNRRGRSVEKDIVEVSVDKLEQITF